MDSGVLVNVFNEASFFNKIYDTSVEIIRVEGITRIKGKGRASFVYKYGREKGSYYRL